MSSIGKSGLGGKGGLGSGGGAGGLRSKAKKANRNLRQADDAMATIFITARTLGFTVGDYGQAARAVTAMAEELASYRSGSQGQAISQVPAVPQMTFADLELEGNAPITSAQESDDLEALLGYSSPQRATAAPAAAVPRELEEDSSISMDEAMEAYRENQKRLKAKLSNTQTVGQGVGADGNPRVQVRQVKNPAPPSGVRGQAVAADFSEVPAHSPSLFSDAVKSEARGR